MRVARFSGSESKTHAMATWRGGGGSGDGMSEEAVTGNGSQFMCPNISLSAPRSQTNTQRSGRSDQLGATRQSGEEVEIRLAAGS